MYCSKAARQLGAARYPPVNTDIRYDIFLIFQTASAHSGDLQQNLLQL